jgi:hypothetical protein
MILMGGVARETGELALCAKQSGTLMPDMVAFFYFGIT